MLVVVALLSHFGEVDGDVDAGEEVGDEQYEEDEFEELVDASPDVVEFQSVEDGLVDGEEGEELQVEEDLDEDQSLLADGADEFGDEGGHVEQEVVLEVVSQQGGVVVHQVPLFVYGYSGPDEDVEEEEENEDGLIGDGDGGVLECVVGLFCEEEEDGDLEEVDDDGDGY